MLPGQQRGPHAPAASRPAGRQGLHARPRHVSRAAPTEAGPQQERASGGGPQERTLTEVSPWGRKRYALGPAGQAGTASTSAAEEGPESGASGWGYWVAAAKEFGLPRGYPDSVTPDYLPFQLWGVPCHLLGSVSGALATSSLLQAVGAGQGPVGAASAAAAIKWITKDGIGSAGRLLVGGRLGARFDEDPKHWRMVAEAFSSLGLALDIATAFRPQSFLLLAGAGNFSKALGRGMTGPCFRSIQTHFARQRVNVGDLAAKELVWEVTAHLAGLVASVGVLRAIEAGGRPTDAVLVWAAVQGAHAAVRYKSLSVLELEGLNVKRAAILIRAHLAGQPLPGIREANQQEQILVPMGLVRPRVRFGAALDEAFPPGAPAAPSPSSNGTPESVGSAPGLGETVTLYRGQGYLLAWRGGQGHAVLREGWTRRLLLRILYQAAWLEGQGVGTATPADHARSLAAAAAAFEGFAAAAGRAGWDVEDNLFSHGRTYLLREGG